LCAAKDIDIPIGKQLSYIGQLQVDVVPNIGLEEAIGVLGRLGEITYSLDEFPVAIVNCCKLIRSFRPGNYKDILTALRKFSPTKFANVCGLMGIAESNMHCMYVSYADSWTNRGPAGIAVLRDLRDYLNRGHVQVARYVDNIINGLGVDQPAKRHRKE
jgi:hypothetical protein